MKLLLKIAAAVLALIVVLVVAGLLILRTDWFHEKLRERAVAEVEKATGGRAEIGRVQFNPKLWYARFDQFTIHGTESPAGKPLFHAQAIEVNLKIVSYLKRTIDVAGLRIVAPEIHIVVGPDGTINFPSPAKRQTAGRVFTEALLDIAVNHFELRDGVLWWNDQRYKLDLAMSDLRSEIRYDPAGLYRGRVEAGRSAFSSPPRLPAMDRFEARFQLLRDRIEISDVFAKSAASEVKSSGMIRNLLKPRWQFQYTASLDAREVATAISVPELRAGRFDVDGSYDSGPTEWNARGRLRAKQVDAANKEFRINNAGGNGEYFVDPRELRVEPLTVRFLGGQWTGRLTAQHSPPGRAVLQGRLEGVRLEEVAQAVTTASRPLNQLGWSADLSGPLNLQGGWPIRARNIVADADLTLTRGLEGSARVSYQGRTSEVQLDAVRLVTAATSVTASGKLCENADSTVQFLVKTSRPDELTNAAYAVTGVRPEIPVRLQGTAAVQGRFSGTIANPAVEATLDVGQFVYEGREWDSFSGRVQWSRRQARLTAGRLLKEKATVNVSLTAQLEGGKFTTTSPFQADVAVRDTPLQNLAALAGQRTPATGAVTATLKVQGTLKDPRGAGSVELRRGTAWGEPFDSLRAAVLLDAGEIRANNVRTVKGKGVITGAGAFHPERKTFRFDARGEALSLADQQLLGRTGRKITGLGSFEFAGSGSPEKLAVNGNIQLKGVSLDDRALGDLSGTVQTVNDKLSVQLDSNFAGAQISGNGEVLLKDRFPLQARLEFRNLDLPAAMQTAGMGSSQARGSANGFVTLTGEALQPDTIAAQGSITNLELGWAQGESAIAPLRSLRSTEPVSWRISKRRLTIDSLHLSGEGSDLKSSGVVDLGPNGPIKLSVNGSLNLGVLSAVDSRVQTTGSSTINIDITGTWADPNMVGRAQIQNASLTSESLPIGLSGANGVIVFSRQRATIQKLTAESGGGQVSLTGDADITKGIVSYRLAGEAHRVRLRYPEGLSSILEGNLTFTGTNQRSRMEGEIQLSRLGTRQSVDLATILAGLKQPPRTPSSNEWLQGAQLNISIVSAPNIRFETSLARNLQADVGLRLRGTILNPSLIGRINITQGELDFQGTHFVLNRGDISFTNPFRIEPILNLDLETRVSQYDITLTLIGPLQKLNVTYRSDPPLTFNEVINLLARGTAPSIDPTLASQQTTQARSLTQIGPDTVIGQAISQPVSGRLQRFFGVSRLKVDPEFMGPEGNPNARITLEQQVGKDVTFTYTYNLASAQEQIIRIQWVVNRQWSVVAVRDQNGLFGIDFFFKRRYR